MVDVTEMLRFRLEAVKLLSRRDIPAYKDSSARGVVSSPFWRGPSNVRSELVPPCRVESQHRVESLQYTTIMDRRYDDPCMYNSGQFKVQGCPSPSLEPASLAHHSERGFRPETRFLACQTPDFVRYPRRRLIGRPILHFLSHCHHRRPSISRCHPRSATHAHDTTSGRLQNQTIREKQAMSAEPATPVAESTPPLARPLLLP